MSQSKAFWERHEKHISSVYTEYAISQIKRSQIYIKLFRLTLEMVFHTTARAASFSKYQ